MAFISEFFGIIIRMFYTEHPPPHFHALYQGQRGRFDFDGNLLKGNICSQTARKLIQEWAVLHKAELEENWNYVQQGSALQKIAPLD